VVGNQKLLLIIQGSILMNEDNNNDNSGANAKLRNKSNNSRIPLKKLPAIVCAWH